MYAASSSSISGTMNGMGPDLDGSGTINPADLNASLSLPATGPSTVADNTTLENPTDDAAGPRGVKRSRSEDPLAGQGDADDDDDDENAPRKRGRPPKTPRASGSAASPPTSTPSSVQRATNPPPTQPQTTPQPSAQTLPQASSGSPPGQGSPPAKATPKSVVKALPTVRDHTTDQLDPEGDEYLPKERDPGGEGKVDENGYPLGGRSYKCRTFRVHTRGTKLFMLATECARVLGYRDSYLLFNKNRSLHKIIASQAEKDELIAQDILPYSYRSRQIAIVTARSMFRQFGSRVIVNGRRVRDDYWESKARKQGFTEEDMAGEKRPGATKARDAAAAAEAVNVGTLPALGHSEVVYSHDPHVVDGGHPAAAAAPPPGFGPGFGTLPMINPAPSNDPRMREYSNFPRPRQEVTGQPYQDRVQPSTAAEILNQASHTAEFNKILNQQRGYRAKSLDDHWHKPREPPPVSDPQDIQTSSSAATHGDASAQALHQHQVSSGMLPSEAHQQQPHSMPSQAYAQGLQQHSQQAISSQSPMRSMGQTIRPDQLHRGSPGMNFPSAAAAAGGGARQYNPYSQAQQQAQQQQMWRQQPPPQPQPSPLGMGQYHPHQIHPQQQQQQQSPSPHPSQSHRPTQSPRSQTRPPAASPQIQGHPHQPQHPQQQQPQPPGMPSVGYPSATGGAPYNNALQGMYSSPSPGHQQQQQPQQQQPQPQQFMQGTPHHQAVSMGLGLGTNAGLPGWPSTAAGGSFQPGQSPAGSSQGGWPTTY